MPNRLFSGNRNVESVAYDVALLLASRDQALATPEQVMNKIKELLPDCLEAAKTIQDDETPPPATNINFTFSR
ncbi:hypothetical protein ABRP72_13200 [Pectobacterium carotovorum]|uniref:hypothetical protein n=1 Tax=Pectobacterium carotovorum TaxID=554 RepID=UPI0032EE865D